MRVRTVGAKVMIWGVVGVLFDGDVLAASAMAGLLRCSKAWIALGSLQGARVAELRAFRAHKRVANHDARMPAMGNAV